MDEHGSIADDALHRDAAIGGYGDFPAAAVARAAEIHDQDTANHI